MLLAFNALSATGALVSSVSSSDALSITLSNAEGQSIKNIDDLRLSAKVTNVGTEPVRVVRFGGILDASHTHSFVVKKGGNEVKFVGVIVRSSLGCTQIPSNLWAAFQQQPQLALTYADDEFYTTLAPNQTVTVEHKCEHCPFPSFSWSTDMFFLA